jgi:hypothetical protein
MTRQDKLELLMLLSALESWGFATDRPFPSYLHNRLAEALNKIQTDVLQSCIQKADS